MTPVMSWQSTTTTPASLLATSGLIGPVLASTYVNTPCSVLPDRTEIGSSLVIVDNN